MKQKIAVRVVIKKDNTALVLRRRSGRSSILGKYELPGGKIDFGEQPKDAVYRYIVEDVGAKSEFIRLVDSMGFIDPDDTSVQYVFIVFEASLAPGSSDVHVGEKYDKYKWHANTPEKDETLTKSTDMLLKAMLDETTSKVSAGKNGDATPNTDQHMIVYSDGGSRGNPGPSAAGYVVLDAHEHMLAEDGEYLGVTTNNQAEYQAVYLGLQKAAELGAKTVDFRVDSMLVVNQMKGIYKIRNRDLWPIHERIRKLTESFTRVTFTHVRREHNKHADSMVNKILDEQENDH